MENFTSNRRLWMAALVGLFVVSIAMPTSLVAKANNGGMDIKIRAQNRSTDDQPALCPGIPGTEGFKGDRLDVDVSTFPDGSAVGTARFEDSMGNVTLMDIDTVLVFFGGLLLQDSMTGNTVPIWFGITEIGGGNFAPVHVNVELPRGCGNTVSTFTLDTKDKVTTQIKFSK